MGTVYLAEDGRTGRPVALKVLRTDRLSPGSVERIQREFSEIASLRHPLIAAAHDFGYTEPGGLPYYTREYVKGSPLPPGPPLEAAPREFLKPILDLLDALHYLDIHAGNLIVADDRSRGSVLIDFGVIRSAGESLSSGGLGERGRPPPGS
jgi:serine/threonine-protein kinase